MPYGIYCIVGFVKVLKFHKCLPMVFGGIVYFYLRTKISRIYQYPRNSQNISTLKKPTIVISIDIIYYSNIIELV